MSYSLAHLRGQIPAELIASLENELNPEPLAIDPLTVPAAEETGYGTFSEDGPGYLTPDDASNVVHIYIRSNWTQEMPGVGGEGVILGTYPGDDDNDGLTPSTPIQSFRALYTKFPTKASENIRYHVHLADAASPNNGFDGGVDCAPLYYQVEEIRVGGGAANYNSYTYSGPPKLRIWHPLGTLTGQSVHGSFPYGQSIATFGAGGHGVDSWSGIVGFFVSKKANGDFFIPQIPLLRHTATDFYLPDSGAAATIGMPVDGTYYVGRAGAVIVTWRDMDPLITGVGTYRAGLQEKVIIPDPDAQSPRPCFYGIEFAGAQVAGDGISFDTCSFLDHPVIVTGKRVEFANCRSTGMWLHDTSGRVFGFRNNLSGNDTNRERASYQHAGITTANPTYGCDIIMTQIAAGAPGTGIRIGGGQRNVSGIEAGAEDGFSAAQLLLYRGIHGYGLTTPLIDIYGHSSLGMCDYALINCHNVDVGIRASGKAEVRVFSNGITFTGTNTANFRIGTGTTGDPQVDVTKADFVNAALWNKNLCIYRPHVPADTYGVGVPAAAVFPYGCMARIYQ